MGRGPQLDKWVSTYRDRHGKLRYRFRRRGKQIALPAPDHPDYEAAYQAARADAEKTTGFGPKHKPGTIGTLIADYYASPDFLDIADSTKATYRGVFEPIRKEHGDRRVRALYPHHLEALLQRHVDNPGAWNKALRFWRMLMKFAIAKRYRRDDPTVGLRKRRMRGGGFKDWPEDLISKFRAHWEPGTRPRLAFELLLGTAQRRSDVVDMGRQHIDGDGIKVRQQKTSTRLWIPMAPALKGEIDRIPTAQMIFLLTEFNKPFTAAGFGNAFRDWCDAAGIPKGYSAHGLRKAACRRLAEAGCSAPEIMAISGHKTLKEVQRYIEAASQKKLAVAALERTKNKSGEPS